MDEQRFQRLEDKVDVLKQDVTELKVNLTVGMEKLDGHIQEVRDHVAGDNKIINEITPVLGQLKEMVDDYSYKKKRKEEAMDTVVSITKKSAMVTAICGALASVLKFLGFF